MQPYLSPRFNVEKFSSFANTVYYVAPHTVKITGGGVV